MLSYPGKEHAKNPVCEQAERERGEYSADTARLHRRVGQVRLDDALAIRLLALRFAASLFERAECSPKLLVGELVLESQTLIDDGAVGQRTPAARHLPKLLVDLALDRSDLSLHDRNARILRRVALKFRQFSLRRDQRILQL